MTKQILSVIIPVYNAEKYLEKCLDSILQANIEGMEVLLVDDGSKDRSAELIRSYEERFSCVKGLHQQNSGPSAARNLGLSQAKGQYVCFFDSDDYIDPTVFANRIRLLQQVDADLWVSDFCRVADNGVVLDRITQIPQEKGLWLCDGCPKAFLGAKDCVWNVWRYLFKRSFLQENGLLFCEGYHCAEDLEFMVRVIYRAKKVALLHDPYYFYRVNYGESLTRTYTFSRVSHLIAMLLQSAKNTAEDEAGCILRAKIAREYILNLSLLYEVPRKIRKQIRRELEKGKTLLRFAQGVYRPTAVVVRLLGISLSAWGLIGMKKIKRRLRKVKELF